MNHPITGQKIYVYFTIWALLAFAHTVVLIFQFHFNIVIALYDSIVFNFLIAGFGLTYWYVIQYLPSSYKDATSHIITHCTGVALSITIICLIQYYISIYLFDNQVYYQSFLMDTLPWRVFIGILYMTLVIVIYYQLLYSYNYREKELKAQKLQNELRQSELEMLKFQINPHFIFNSLNSISALTMTEPAQAREMIIKLADFFRSSLGTKNEELRSLAQELDQMQLYLEIEKVRFGERLRIENDIDPVCLSMTIPNMILQPIYENAIKFGIYQQINQVHLYTRCWCTEGSLKIAVTNNFEDEGAIKDGKGIGLQNIRYRLELIYGIPNLLQVEKKEQHFTAQINIPQPFRHD